MMSISQVSSAGAASSYYQGDNYYAKDGKEGQGLWFGKAAESLELAGKNVDPIQFENIMSGEMPNGQSLGSGAGEEKKHIAGYDLTFSAPKSVSIMALVAGKKVYGKAHEEAVKSTLETVENDFLKTRVSNNKTKQQDVVGKQSMIAAMFTHDISRNEDPQLHTHCVIANAAMDENGKFRSVHSRVLFENKMLIGEIYRSHLKANILELGGQGITQTHLDGRFELTGFNKTVRKAFSTRSQEISQYLGEGAHTAEDKATAALRTRKNKTQTSREELKSSWDNTLKELNVKPSQLFESEVTLDSVQNRVLSLDRSKPLPSLERAVLHLSETSSTFKKQDVLRFMLAEGNGRFLYEEAKEVLEDSIGKVWLKTSADQNFLFTQDTLNREIATLNFEKEGRAAVDPILPRKAVQKTYEGHSLTDGQLKASSLILTSPNRTIGVQGYAGTGKTFMLASAALQAKQAGFKVLGLAPTSNATKTLGDDADIKAQTLQSFLQSPSGNHKTVLFVDEASLISTRQMQDLLAVAEERRLAKVVLVGDTKQLSGVAAGVPFNMLQSQDMRYAVMDEIKRQKETRHLEAVKGASNGDIDRAFKKLGNDILEVPFEDLSKETAETWLKSHDRKNAAIVVTTNTLADSVNTHVKAGLISEGAISENSQTVKSLKPLRLSEQQRQYANNFREADMVRFNRSYDGLNVMAGDTLPIQKVRQDGVIELLKDDKLIEFKPSRHAKGSGAVEAFRAEKMQINEGDRVRWTRPDYANDIKNMDTGHISEIKDGHVSIKMLSGETVSYENDHIQLSFLKHAWAQTGHAYQGQTIDHIIIAMPSISSLTTQKSFYVDISRARHKVSFLTDNVERLKDTLKSRTGEERTALDLVAEKEASLGFEQRANETSSSEQDKEQETPKIQMSLSR